MRQKLHSKAIWLFFVGDIIELIVMLAIFFILAVVITGRPMAIISLLLSNLSWWLALIVIVVLGIVNYIVARVYYDRYLFEFAENAIKIEKGIIRKKYVSIPYERIQNVDIERGVLARILGLSDLQIQTAGYGGEFLTEGRLPGLSVENAENLREEIMKKAGVGKQGL